MQIDNTTYACDVSIDAEEFYNVRLIPDVQQAETRLFEINYPDTAQSMNLRGTGLPRVNRI